VRTPAGVNNLVEVLKHEDISNLVHLLVNEHDRIVRLWAKRLRVELHELNLSSRDLRSNLSFHVSELGRLLSERGEEAVELWAEVVRPWGTQRFDQRFEADDVVREFKVLHQLLLGLYARRYKKIDPELAIFLAELFGEAIAALEDSFARVLKTEEVRFRDAALMESVLHHVDVGILVAEPDGTLTYATPPVGRLFGVPVRAFLGTRAPKTLAAVLAQMNARHTNGQPFRVEHLPFLKALSDRVPSRSVSMVIERPPRGEEVLIEMSAIPILDEGNGDELLGVIQTLTDRSESVRKSRELVKAHEELRKLQGRLLQRTRAQALGQLASNTAHSLNNFLNVLRLRITLLRKDFKPDHLDALDRTVRNVGELIARLQDFAAVKTEEQLSVVDFSQLVREAIDLAKPDLSQGDPPTRVELEQTSHAKVRVDASVMRELLVNLLTAARDRAQGSGSGSLSVRTYEEEGRVFFKLRDEGPPMSPEELAKLFDPLKGQSPSPHLSLMLGVARNQLLRWGGELDCRNAPDTEAGGSEWTLILPTAKAEEKASEPPHPLPTRVRAAPAHRLGGANLILVVDDEPENARMLAEVLTDEGYRVKIAHSGEAALHAWEHHVFDAALLDGLMPDMTGWELAREIRARSPHVLLAMITGADVRGQNRASLALVDAVFRKPIDVAALDDFLSQESSGEHREGSEPSQPSA